MPYIDNIAKDLIEPVLEPLLKDISRFNAGDLNYILTRIVDEWVGVEKPSYFGLSQGITAFECAKLEFYRRRLAPYENKKCAINGDVYQQRDFKPLPAIELPGKDESNGQS